MTSLIDRLFRGREPEAAPPVSGITYDDAKLLASHEDPAVRRLMLAHEEEHLHAKDPLLLLVASCLTILLPWNLPLWWQLRRLRLELAHRP